MENPASHSGPVTRPAGPLDHLRAAVQAPLPHHALSRVVFRLTRCRARWVRRPLIHAVVKAYGVDLGEAAEPDPDRYPSFNAFFTRALAPGARPVADGTGEVACPVDGVVSQAGVARGGRVFQAKGRSFTVDELLGGVAERAEPFRGGAFATLYLSPRDYHRIHMPVDGRLVETVHVPGRLFSVDSRTTRAVPRLFARNERVAALFDTAVGPLAVVMVGALLVSAVETVWAGQVTPPRGRRVRRLPPPPAGVELARGEELGRFNMGSTVILLFPPGIVRWRPGLVPEAEVRVGQAIGDLSPDRA